MILFTEKKMLLSEKKNTFVREEDAIDTEKRCKALLLEKKMLMSEKKMLLSEKKDIFVREKDAIVTEKDAIYLSLIHI